MSSQNIYVTEIKVKPKQTIFQILKHKNCKIKKRAVKNTFKFEL